VFSTLSVPRGYKQEEVQKSVFKPCGGGFEYLYRDSERRRRRQKEKSQIWDSKIWSRVPRDSHPRKTTLARDSSIYKRQTPPLVRESTPQKQDLNCQRVGARHQDLLIDWPSVAMWLWLEVSSQSGTGVCEERTCAGGRVRAIVGTVARKPIVSDWEHYTVCSSVEIAIVL
jgi:hypothetical protein